MECPHWMDGVISRRPVWSGVLYRREIYTPLFSTLADVHTQRHGPGSVDVPAACKPRAPAQHNRSEVLQLGFASQFGMKDTLPTLTLFRGGGQGGSGKGVGNEHLPRLATHNQQRVVVTLRDRVGLAWPGLVIPWEKPRPGVVSNFLFFPSRGVCSRSQPRRRRPSPGRNTAFSCLFAVPGTSRKGLRTCGGVWIPCDQFKPTYITTYRDASGLAWL